MIVRVLSSGTQPGDHAIVQIHSEPDGGNTPEVFELAVSTRPRPIGARTIYQVELRAGDGRQFPDDNDPEREPLTLYKSDHIHEEDE